jgi:hypothetical protein
MNACVLWSRGKGVATWLQSMLLAQRACRDAAWK